ncbi:hypothetical protein JOM56_008252 [Amanita muscaria]
MLSLFPQDSLCPLPIFNTLLVTGNYHPSAPIHLALSYLIDRPDDNVLILTKSREALIKSLALFKDECVLPPAQRGLALQDSLHSRVTVMYPPSLVQLVLVLSGIESRKLEHCAPLRGIPGVIVLHEISAYFQTPETSATVNLLVPKRHRVRHIRV